MAPSDAATVRTPWRAVEQVMGMPISIALRGRHAGDAVGSAAWARVLSELREVDRVFSTYRADSVISRLGREEIGVEDCPPEVAEVLGLAARAERDSGGVFSAWRSDAAGVLRLDPSGVVKGWAVERAARHLRVLADTDSCLSAGGDLTCHVADAASAPWGIGVEDPADPRRLLARIPVRSGAVATSGATHRGAHVVDARTGRTPQLLASVTVVAASLTDADIDATTAFALDGDAVAWLGLRPCAALVVWRDGRTETVTGRPY